MTDKENPNLPEDAQERPTDGSDIDWNAKKLMHHPKGMDQAVADNISKMEAQTREIIQNGSIEEIEAALERNLEELAALQKHMEKLANRDLSQV